MHDDNSMMHTRSAGILLLLITSAALAAAEAPDFDRAVRPILATSCISCHGA